jgi:exopolysaccharide biosynthesis polyprenyl glycosylphosphotransferase
MNKNRQTVLFLGDTLALSISLWLMTLIRFNPGVNSALIAVQTKLFIYLFIVWLIVFFIFDLYTIKRINPNPRNIGFLILAITLNTVIGVFFFYLFPTAGISPKVNLLIVSLFSFVFLAIWRRIFYHLFAQQFKRTIAVIGTSAASVQLIEELKKHPYVGVVAYVWETVPAHIEANVDLIIAEPSKPLELLVATREMNCEVISLQQAYESLFGKIPVSLMTEGQAMRILSKTNQNNMSVHVLYRFIEVCIASLIIIIASPFLLIAIIAIKIQDNGPLFYRQARVGRYGKPFELYKLRSMVVDAEKEGAQWAQKHDQRITTIGKILRKTHIDEVPQMINIIKGDIALIGPRPERPEYVSELEKQIPYYFLRHIITPGFTGWAQIKFRYARTVMDSREKFEYDLYYIANKNPILDFGIFLKTIQIIFTH